MNYRSLGETGISVSEIGMGCWGIGSDAYGKRSDEVAKATIREALVSGITLFDTADVYGAGHSEELLGEVVNEWGRDEVIIATKVGSLPHRGREMPHIFTPQHIRYACDASLMRLKTDYIDIYQLHSPPVDVMPEALEVLRQLQDAGKVQVVGISAKSPQNAMEGFIEGAETLQFNFNLIDQRAEVDMDLLDQCAPPYDDVGLIARTPLAFGFLAGRYQSGHLFQTPHHLAYWPQAQLDVWAEAYKLFDAIRPPHLSMAQFALSFILTYNTISSVIPGMLTPDEVRANLRWERLPEHVMDAVKDVYLRNEFFI